MWKCFWLGGDLAEKIKEGEREREMKWTVGKKKQPLHNDKGAGTKHITLHFCHIQLASNHTVEKQQATEL